MKRVVIALLSLTLAAASLADSPVEKNADLTVALTFADGRKVEGHVIRIERGQDWYAEQGWVDSAAKLTLPLEGGGTEVERAWGDIRTIDVKYGGKTDVDCMYESEFTPWMYSCTLQTTATVKTADGKTWTGISRHKWRFVFDDGRTEEFFVKKLPMRRQEEATEERAGTENHQLYAALQSELWTQAQKAVTKIEIKPPSP
jgi:hypothetical protein